MGECGCGETNPHALLEGPGDVTYGIQVYGGCVYCHTPLAVDVYRFNPEFAQDFFEGVPKLTIQPYGVGDARDPDGDGVGTLILFEPDRLVKLAAEDEDFTGMTLEDMRPNDWRRFLGLALEAQDPQTAVPDAGHGGET